MGGSRWPGVNLPGNLLTLCGSGTTGCHGWVESHPTWAEAHGWSVRRSLQDAVTLVPIWTWRGWVRIRNDGHLMRLPGHGGVDACTCGCRPIDTRAGVWDTPEGSTTA